MADPNELNRKISAFYDDYHRNRERQPDAWMQTHYWPAFVGTTLEVGGGTLHPERGDYAIVDLSAEAVRKAHSKSIPGAVANGSQLPFKTGAFDTVACHDVLEHVVEPAVFMRELCRVAKKRVVIGGPNFVNGEQGHLDRRLIGWLWSFITNPASRLTHLDDPYLSFDEKWGPDKDAVTAPNAAWVADELKKSGYAVTHLRTWEVTHSWLNRFPVLRCFGPFMFVVGDK